MRGGPLAGAHDHQHRCDWWWARHPRRARPLGQPQPRSEQQVAGSRVHGQLLCDADVRRGRADELGRPAGWTGSPLAWFITLAIGVLSLLLAVDDSLRTSIASIFSKSSVAQESQESLEYLDRQPELCEAGTGTLGCSYRFRVSGLDLVRAFNSEPTSARLALVGPSHASDSTGKRWLLVRVRVTALTSSVSVNPSEFVSVSSSGRAAAALVAVPGPSDQVRSPVQVAAHTDFVGTLAFPEQSTPARHIDWVRLFWRDLTLPVG